MTAVKKDSPVRTGRRASSRLVKSTTRELVERLPTPAVHVDPDRRVFPNVAAEALTGFTRHEVPTVDAWFRAVYRERTELMRRLYEEDRGRGFLEPRVVTLTHADGSAICVEESRAMVANEELWLLSELGADRRRGADYVWDAARDDTLARIAGGVAHHFNNVLTTTQTSASLLARGPVLSPPEVRELGAEIERASQRASMLTRRLLSFTAARVERPTRYDLAEIVRQLLPMLRSAAPTGVDIRIESAYRALPVDAVRTQLEQAILDVAVNALDATPSGGNVIIRVYPAQRGEAEVAVLEVRDPGEGMSPETRERAFEPFFTTKAGATGLGLSAARTSITQAGGVLDIVETGPSGTTVAIELPLRPTARRPLQPKRDDVDEPLRVLVVEDDTGVRRAMCRALGRAGHHVEDFEDGERAIACARQASFDVLVTDVVMPGLTGPRVAQQVRELHPTIAVLFVSGFADDAYGLVAGDAAFLAKPFSAEVLVARVRELVRDRLRAL